TGGTDMMKAMEEVADEDAQAGPKAYIIPGCGSNSIGATGSVKCIQELQQQMFEQGLDFDYIVAPSGSAGTHAGVVVGVYGNNLNIPVLGMNVSRKKEVQEELVYNLVKRTAEHVGCPVPPRESVVCFDEYVGAGYSRPTPGMVEAVKLLARTEGILLDPVYTGKEMAGLVDLVRRGFFKKDDKVLFLHTGGSPALYAYTDTVLAGEE
ncbi:MAG: pyridoxal-phosphate dependent enzyme, partial [Bacillota bacterium]